MKIKKFILNLTLGSFLLNPILVFADPDDPIMGLISKTKPSESNQATSNTTTTNKKPTVVSDSPDDDDEDFPTDDKPKDNNLNSLNTGSDAITNMLLQSVSLMGLRYKWGGNSPTSGMDCSGFVKYVYQKSLGINLPRTAAEQARVGKRVSIDDLKPGDLLFFNSRRGSNTHVGMYVGNNKFIHSPRTGDVIKISEFTDSWRKRFNGAKRIVADNNNSDDNSSLQNLQSIRDEPLPVTKRVITGKTSTRKGKKSRGSSTKQAKSSKKSAKTSSTTNKTKKKKSN